MYLPLHKVADTPFDIQRDDIVVIGDQRANSNNRHFGYERVCYPLCEVAYTPSHMQRG